MKWKGTLLYISLFCAVSVNAATNKMQALDASLDCVIEPYEVTEVSSAVNGVIQEVYVKKGDRVKKGQKLALLESSVERATVALAKARSNQKEEILQKKANWTYFSRKQRRIEKLFKSGNVTPNEKEEAELNTEIARLEYKTAKKARNIAKLELARAKAALKLRTITSPLDGVVVESYASPGEATMDKPLFKLAQLDPLRVVVIAKAQTYGKIKPGMTGKVRTAIDPEKVLQAKVDIIAPVMDAASSTYDILLTLPNKDNHLPGGLRCRIQFDSVKK